jgi:N-acetylglucosamine-6-phosphate deacetylase
MRLGVAAALVEVLSCRASVPWASAAGAASPLRRSGRRDLGRLAVGAPADVVVLDDRLEVQRVLIAGAAVG